MIESGDVDGQCLKFEDEVSTGSGSDRVTSWQTRFLLSVATRSLPLPVLTSSRQRHSRHHLSSEQAPAVSQEKSEKQSRRRRDQNRLSRFSSRIVFCFIGNLIKVLSLQVLELIAEYSGLLFNVITRAGCRVRNFSAVFVCRI